MSNRKTVFLILRVDPEFKELVVVRARTVGKTISQLVRELLTKSL
jgi:hypothetical protein